MWERRFGRLKRSFLAIGCQSVRFWFVFHELVGFFCLIDG